MLLFHLLISCLCLSIDHRILDGLQAGRFMNYVKSRIEQYSIENTSIF